MCSSVTHLLQYLNKQQTTKKKISNSKIKEEDHRNSKLGFWSSPSSIKDWNCLIASSLAILISSFCFLKRKLKESIRIRIKYRNFGLNLWKPQLGLSFRIFSSSLSLQPLELQLWERERDESAPWKNMGLYLFIYTSFSSKRKGRGNLLLAT